MDFNNIVIRLSKKKLLITLTAILALVLIASLFILHPKVFVNPYIQNYKIIKIIGMVGFILFGFGGILGVKKIFDKKPGLIISEQGIFDNSSASGVGLIEWQDIVAIDIFKGETAKGVIIKVLDNDKYLNRVKNKIVKYNMKSMSKSYETPIIITAANLKIDNEQLQKLIIQNFEKFKIKKEATV